MASQWLRAADRCSITVAGPRRLRTGLPLTTGLCARGTLHPRRTERGGLATAAAERKGRPCGRPFTYRTRIGSYFFFFFFLHFWLKLDDFVLPSVNVVVSL
jgi:hypothetical protein